MKIPCTGYLTSIKKFGQHVNFGKFFEKLMAVDKITSIDMNLAEAEESNSPGKVLVPRARFWRLVQYDFGYKVLFLWNLFFFIPENNKYIICLSYYAYRSTLAWWLNHGKIGLLNVFMKRAKFPNFVESTLRLLMTYLHHWTPQNLYEILAR